jgi:hypothetical protein
MKWRTSEVGVPRGRFPVVRGYVMNAQTMSWHLWIPGHFIAPFVQPRYSPYSPKDQATARPLTELGRRPVCGSLATCSHVDGRPL